MLTLLLTLICIAAGWAIDRLFLRGEFTGIVVAEARYLWAKWNGRRPPGEPRTEPPRTFGRR